MQVSSQLSQNSYDYTGLKSIFFLNWTNRERYLTSITVVMPCFCAFWSPLVVGKSIFCIGHAKQFLLDLHVQDVWLKSRFCLNRFRYENDHKQVYMSKAATTLNILFTFIDCSASNGTLIYIYTHIFHRKINLTRDHCSANEYRINRSDLNFLIDYIFHRKINFSRDHCCADN